MLPQEIIRKKRDNQELSTDEINNFINGITNNSISEGQIAAMTMAIYLNGMDKKEIITLTKAMMNSGTVIDWSKSGIEGHIIDKHSTGGVGDKVSLMLAPMLASVGVFVPMISGRGLGHTGGTLDKFDAIEGYTTVPSTEKFKKVVKEVGCAIIGQTGDLAPADKRIYGVRDVTATVESIPLITASILSKKLAAGLDTLIMDLKFGNGAFMSTMEDAKSLAKSIVGVANGAGTSTSAIITDMNQVLGHSAGNAVEVKEAIEFLTNKHRDKRMEEITIELCAEALMLKDMFKNHDEAKLKLKENLDNGKAAEIFEKMVSALGGNSKILDNYKETLPKANIIKPIYAKKSGFISSMNTRNIGLSVITLGGGRTHPDQKLDYSVGITDILSIGDEVSKDSPIAFIHANDQKTFDIVENDLINNIIIEDEPPSCDNVIYEVIKAKE